MRRMAFRLSVFAAVVLLGLVAIATRVWLQSLEGPGHLTVKWEGAVNDRNARDLGAGLNACLGEPYFAAGKVWRAAQWFSGWSCAGVGDPDVILSLNAEPGDDTHYYCRADGVNRVGVQAPLSAQLNNLEFIETWSDPAQRTGLCWYLREAAAALTAGQRLLVHCEAGRDRTGALSGLLAALALEAGGRLDAPGISAIECDYRRSESLKELKYGRLATLIAVLKEGGGPAAVLAKTCDLPVETLAAAGRAFRL